MKKQLSLPLEERSRWSWSHSPCQWRVARRGPTVVGGGAVWWVMVVGGWLLSGRFVRRLAVPHSRQQRRRDPERVVCGCTRKSGQGESFRRVGNALRVWLRRRTPEPSRRPLGWRPPFHLGRKARQVKQTAAPHRLGSSRRQGTGVGARPGHGGDGNDKEQS